MTESRQDITTDAGLVLLAMIWGVNFSVMKVVLEELDPLAVNALRFPLAAIALGGPVLSLVPPPADPVFGLAWMGEDGATAALRFATNATRANTGAWSSTVEVTAGYSAGAELALAADPAGDGGFTLLVSGGPLGGVVHARGMRQPPGDSSGTSSAAARDAERGKAVNL